MSLTFYSMVELTYIAQQITKNKAICEKLVVRGGNNTIYRTLFNAVNGRNNLVVIPTDVNHAKSLALTANKKSLFLRSSKKAKVRHCSLSHDMTRLSLPTDWSSQVSDSNQPKHKSHFSESCVEYDWRHGGTIFRRVYQVIYEQLQPVGCRRYCPVSESRFSLAVSHCNCSIAARIRAPQLPFPHLAPRLSQAPKPPLGKVRLRRQLHLHRYLRQPNHPL